MPSNLQPANYLTSSRYSDATIKYRVIRSNGKELLLENNLCRTLYVGQRLTVDTDSYALVTRVEGELALAVMTDLKSPAFVATSDWTPLALPSSKLLIPPTLVGKLYVRCSNALTEKPGYVGWSLYDDDRNLIAIGNDYESHNVCQISGTGSWSGAVYILEVRSFLTGSLQPINFATKTWYPENPVTTLSVGALNDGQTSLILS
jgi:hypothetical protein